MHFRCLATQAAVKDVKPEKVEKNTAAKESQSFTMNIFRGELQTSQVFPYPQAMSQEQSDTLKLLVDPIEKFFEVTELHIRSAYHL